MMPEEEQAMRSILRDCRDATILELGAYDGQNTKLMLQWLPNKPARFFQFEPDPVNIARIQELKLEGVRLCPWAISDRDGEAVMYLSRDKNTHSTWSLSSTLKKPTLAAQMWSHLGQGGISWDQTTKVPVQKLDSFVREQGIDRIDLLFVDVEGSEREVIRGGQKALAMTRWLWIEAMNHEKAYADMWDRREILDNLPGWTVRQNFTSDLLLERTEA